MATINDNAGDDTLYGTSGNDTINGLSGTNTIYGDTGNDVFYSGTGEDTFYGEDDDDRFAVVGSSTAHNVFYGGAGTDTLDYSAYAHAIYLTTGGNVRQTSGSGSIIMTYSGVENFIGTDYDDVIAFSEGLDFNDNVIYGGAGNDYLGASRGNDTIDGEAGDDILYGGSGDDWLAGGADQDTLYGESGEDYLHGGRNNDLLYGGTGNDELYGSNGDDELYGGSDNDELYGDGGNDTLYGETGDDLLYGGNGHDNLYGGAGADTLDGGVDTKIDTFHFDDGTIFSGLDTVVNFEIGRDKIDLSDVLDVYYTDGVDDIADFVSISDNGTDTTISIDLDGTGSTHNSYSIAVVEDTIWANFTQFDGDLVKV